MAGKVLIVHYTPPGVIGGVEWIVQQHAELLAERGFSIELVAGRTGETAFPLHVIPEIDAAASQSRVIEAELATGTISPAFHVARRVILGALRPLLDWADYVIVHNAFTLHFSLPLTAALWQLAAFRAPGSVVSWSHDLAWTNPLYQPELHSGYPWELLSHSAPGVRYVAISQERASELLGLWGGGEVQVVPNGVDAAEFLRLSEETRKIVAQYKLFDCDIVLLLPARITRRKNIEAAIGAVAALRRRGLRVRFLVTAPLAPHHPARSLQYLSELRKLADDLKVSDSVVFLTQELEGNLDEQVVAELYAVADALLLPSQQEGFGLPILEAGLAKIPAVVSDIPILREVGEEDVRTFGLDEDADRIAGEILEAVNSGPQRLFRRVLRDYRWEVIVDRQILPLLGDIGG